MFTKPVDAYPRLLADVGGTNVRFALETAAQVIEFVRVVATADHPTLLDAIRHYLSEPGLPCAGLTHAAIGIANPVLGDHIQMTNHDWQFSIRAVRDALGWQTLQVVNDFTALAYALPHLPASGLRAVGGGQARERMPRLLIGPGTGLGVSGLVPSHTGQVALAGEGGHVSFTPVTDDEARLWQFMRQRYDHVSAERLLSGSGLSFIHAFLSGAVSAKDLDLARLCAPDDITREALNGESSVSVRTVDMFCAMLGTVAADFALMLGALGGVFIGGGIVPRLGDAFASSSFRDRFESKGRFSDYLKAIPVHVIHTPQPALIGLSAALSSALSSAHADHGVLAPV